MKSIAGIVMKIGRKLDSSSTARFFFFIGLMIAIACLAPAFLKKWGFAVLIAGMLLEQLLAFYFRSKKKEQ